MKKKRSLIMLMFMISLLICVAIGGYIMIVNNINQSTWTTRYSEGYIDEMILYNQFPDNELYIRYTDGNYTLIHGNPFWTHAQLSVSNFSNMINITYQVNGYGFARALNVREIESE